MPNLPPTASSWDITTLSRAQQLAASRALIQQPDGGHDRSGPFGPRPACRCRPAGPPAPAVRRDRARLHRRHCRRRHAPGPGRIEPARAGVGPADLPPASPDRRPCCRQTAVRPVKRPAGPAAVGAAAEGRPGPHHHRPAPRRGPDRMFRLIARHEGASEAHRLRARAFTSDRGIVIPAVGREPRRRAGRGAPRPRTDPRRPAGPARAQPPGRSPPRRGRCSRPRPWRRNGLPYRCVGPFRRPGPAVLRRTVWSARAGTVGACRAATLPLAAPGDLERPGHRFAGRVHPRQDVGAQPRSGPRSEVFTALGPCFTPSWPSVAAAIPPPARRRMQRADDASTLAPQASPSPARLPRSSAGRVLGRPSDEDLSNLSRGCIP